MNDPRPFIHPPDSRDIFLLPNAGRYHSVGELQIARPMLWKKSLEEIAQYADYVTRGSCNESWMIDKSRILSTINIEKFATGCAVSLGNTAYLALHCDNESVKAAANLIITKWKKYEQNSHTGYDYFTGIIFSIITLGIICWLWT